MHKEIAMKWADELESGNWKQAKGQLQKGDGFCCLGVLAKMLGVNPGYLGTHLPKEAQDKAGMRSNNGCPVSGVDVDPDNSVLGSGCLVDANDNGKSFPEIADWIRENYVDL